MKYRNFYGKAESISEMDQQHLSNIIWYNKVVLKSFKQLDDFSNEIKLRFNDELLPYKPHHKFKDEIDWLNDNGHFVWNEDKTRADIIIHDVESSNNKVIGYYETTEFIRDKKIEEILK